jgi:hypothetical protein
MYEWVWWRQVMAGSWNRYVLWEEVVMLHERLQFREVDCSFEVRWEVCCTFVRNFPCQTLKIRNVSLVVMGS